MIIKAKLKSTINELNKTLTKLEARGWRSYRDNIRERAFIFKLRVRKRK